MLTFLSQTQLSDCQAASAPLSEFRAKHTHTHTPRKVAEMRHSVMWISRTHTRPEGYNGRRGLPKQVLSSGVSCSFIVVTCILVSVVTAHHLACSVSPCPLLALNIWSLTPSLCVLLFSVVDHVAWSCPFSSLWRKRSLFAVLRER